MRAALTLFLVTLALGCDEPQPRPADPRMPPGHPPFAGGGGAMQMPAMQMDMPMPTGEVLVRGTIDLAPDLAAKRPANATLFITARPAAQGTTGPAVLVKRMAATSFPVAFELGTQNVMMQGMPLPSEMVIQARLDQDGDAISRLPGDLAGATKQPAKRGDDVSIVLDELVTVFKPGRPIE